MEQNAQGIDDPDHDDSVPIKPEAIPNQDSKPVQSEDSNDSEPANESEIPNHNDSEPDDESENDSERDEESENDSEPEDESADSEPDVTISNDDTSNALDMIFKEEILPRVDFEDLSSLRQTCKNWHNVLQETLFILKHLNLSDQVFLRVKEEVYVINPHKEKMKSAPLPCFLEFGIDQKLNLIHCDGLFLVHVHYRDSSLFLWNPCLRSYRQIFSSNSFSEFDRFGIGYHENHKAVTNTPRDYKVLRFSDVQMKSVEKGTEEWSAEILDLKTCVSKPLEASVEWKIESSCHGLSIEGNMYWLTFNAAKSLSIHGFNFTNEKFHKVSELVFVDPDEYPVKSLASFGGNKLSLLLQQGDVTDIQLWVSTSLGEDMVSWKQLFTFSNLVIPHLGSINNVAYPCHFLGEDNNTLHLLCRREFEIEEDSDDDSDDDVRSRAYIYMYKISEEMIISVRYLGGDFWEPLMCGYAYTPSFVQVPNLPRAPKTYKRHQKASGLSVQDL